MVSATISTEALTLFRGNGYSLELRHGDHLYMEYDFRDPMKIGKLCRTVRFPRQRKPYLHIVKDDRHKLDGEMQWAIQDCVLDINIYNRILFSSPSDERIEFFVPRRAWKDLGTPIHRRPYDPQRVMTYSLLQRWELKK